MAKQKQVIRHECGKVGCSRLATIGVYSWEEGGMDVDLDKPLTVRCGRHKPKLNRLRRLRNVEIRVR